MRITLKQIARALPRICAQDTSYKHDPAWSPDNPVWGHCAVAALLVQEFLGGDLLRISLAGTPFAKSRFHYFNQLPNGKIVDLTGSQFGTWTPRYCDAVVRRRTAVLYFADVAQRYTLLRRRLLRRIHVS